MKRASSVLMPISGRRALVDLSDEVATKVQVLFYLPKRCGQSVDAVESACSTMSTGLWTGSDGAAEVNASDRGHSALERFTKECRGQRQEDRYTGLGRRFPGIKRPQLHREFMLARIAVPDQFGATNQAKAAIGKRVTVVDYPDGRLAIRYRGIELPYRTFDKIRQVSQAAIVENKQLGAALAFIREEQLRREPERRSGPRRRDQRDVRLFKVG